MIPRIDHYIGRKFEKVIPAAEGTCQWALVLDGPVLIRNYDDEYYTPSEDPTGLALLAVEYGTETELKFGNYNPDGSVNYGATVTFDPHKYSISTSGEQEVWPQRDEAVSDTPDDPSEDRVQAGPEHPELYT